MNDKNNKTTDDQEQLLDHLIEYGGKQYIEEEVQKFEDIPELEPSKEFDDKMQAMFKKAYQKEVRKERMQLGKKIAAVFVIVLGIAMVTAMNVKAFREPVLNFIFRSTSDKNKTKINIKNTEKIKEKFKFGYIPDGYKCVKEQHLHDNTQMIYDYKNSKNEHIYIKMELNQKYDTYNNINKSSYTKIKNSDCTYYFINGSLNKLLWYKENIIFNISSNLNENEMIQIANNIKFSNK